jgi:hypothetical protein
MPALIGCATVGVCGISQRRNLRYALLALVGFPWLVGIQWSYGGTAWGPGFELRPYHSVGLMSANPSPTFGPGMAIPTPEGPRPLLGHAYVLLLGGWRHFVTEYSLEQESAVLKSRNAKLPLLIDEQGQSWFANILVARGYFTEDSALRTISDNQSLLERRWIARDGSYIRVLQFTEANDLFNVDAIDKLRVATAETVVISGFSRTLLRLQQIAPESLETLGKRTALLHLDRLHAKLKRS